MKLNWSGTKSYHRYYVHAAGLEMKVEWDEQKEVPAEMMMRNFPEHDEWIRKFSERFNLPYSQPKWYLASLYF